MAFFSEQALGGAGREIRSVGAPGAGFAVWGHSQGGHAALFAGQLARAYTSELSPAGFAVPAQAGDLAAMAAVSGACAEGLGEALALSYDAAPLRRGFRIGDVALTEPWRWFMAIDDPGHAPLGAPLMMTQGGTDPIVPPCGDLRAVSAILPARGKTALRRAAGRRAPASRKNQRGCGCDLDPGMETRACESRHAASEIGVRAARPSPCGGARSSPGVTDSRDQLALPPPNRTDMALA